MNIVALGAVVSIILIAIGGIISIKLITKK